MKQCLHHQRHVGSNQLNAIINGETVSLACRVASALSARQSHQPSGCAIAAA